jgi:bacterioferritin (cytochrome b1)
LLFLEQPNLMRISKLAHIGEPVVEQLMLDLQIDEMQATDIFYSSNTFTQLADKTTQLYEKNWTEIYKLLLDESKIER